MGKLIDADVLKKRFIKRRSEIEEKKKYGWEWEYDGINCAIFLTGVEAAKNGIRWMPCDEALPDNEDYVLCTTETKKGDRQVVRGYFMPDMKQWVCGMNSNVIAWMPLPTPWEGKE